LKVFYIDFLKFIILTILIFFVLNKFQGFYNNEPSHYKLQYKEVFAPKAKTVGIIIGTSHHSHSIMPSLLDSSGIKFYNFSLNGSSPGFYLDWLQEILIKYHGVPTYCVVGIDWFMFDKNWVTRSFEQDAEYYPNDFFIKKLFGINEFDTYSLLVNRFPAIKFRSEILKSLQLQAGDSLYPIAEYDRGFIPFYLPYAPWSFKVPKKAAIFNSEVENFEKLISTFTRLKIKIVFVMSPEYGISPSAYGKMKSLQIVEQISAKHKIKFLNFNTSLRSEINDSTGNFSDWGHMNKKGSTLFSKKLCLALKKEIRKDF